MKENLIIFFKIGETTYFGITSENIDLNNLPQFIKFDILFELKLIPVQSKLSVPIQQTKETSLTNLAISTIPAGIGFLQKDVYVNTDLISIIKILTLEDIEKDSPFLKQIINFRNNGQENNN